MGSFASRLQALALSLGGPGLFIVSFLDSSFLSLPEINDILLIWMVTQHKNRMPYYAACAVVGSLVGCLALYYIGRKGEQWVARRFNAASVERAMRTFQRYGVLTVLVPCLLPPPAPFKIFILLAGVAGISVTQFTLAILIGRVIRYFGEGFLAIRYGDAAIEFVSRNSKPVGLALVGVILAGLVIYLVIKRTRAPKRL